MRWAASFPVWRERNSLGGIASPEGRRTVAWEELWELFAGGRAVAWEEQLPSPGRIAVAGEVLASLGGRVLAWEGMLPSLGMVVVAGEALASLGGRVLGWEGMLPSPGMIAVAREVLASTGGRLLAREGMLPSLAGGICLGSGLINLTACLYNKVIYVCVSIVGPSYISFLSDC